MLLTFIQCCLLPVVVIAYSVLSDVVMMATLITVLGYSYFGACMHVYTGCGWVHLKMASYAFHNGEFQAIRL